MIRPERSHSRVILALVVVVAALVGVGLLVLREGRPGPAAPVAIARGADLELRASVHPDVPRHGGNQIRFELRDAQGAPVDDTELDVRHSMSMAGMADMARSARAERLGNGVYQADLDLPMSGTWQLEIDATRAGTVVAIAGGSLTTGTPGLRLEDAPSASAGPSEGGRPVQAVRIDADRRQRTGIRTGLVERGPFVLGVRAAGRVTWDETTLVDVSLKTRGWVRELRANALGMPIQRGDVLFSVYSPELYAAQIEYLSALRSRQATSDGAPSLRTDALLRAARTRLRLWDVSDADVEALARRGTPSETLPIRAPAGGFLLEKNVVEGGTIEPGMRLFRIAPLGRVWIDAQLYEADVDVVTVGTPAVVRLSSQPGSTLEARVAYVYPTLENDTRTGRARLQLENPDLRLRPDMWADVELRVDRGERLLVPVSAVLYAGRRRVVFVDLGDGRLAPRDVEIGLGNGEVYEVVSGLEPGERVVVSGNFLVAAESRLRSALESW